MSFTQFVILIVAFTILYKFVIPYLFPSAGGHVIRNVQRPGKPKDGTSGDASNNPNTPAGDEPQEDEVAYVIQGSGVPMFGGHRAVAKGDMRRRTAGSKSNMS